MARKKIAGEHKCLHCAKDFPLDVKWCAKCEDHMGTSSWSFGKDVCDRCHTGENDEYLKRKKGRDARIAAAVAAAQDPKNWGDSGAVERFEKWCSSPEYPDRFRWKPPVQKAEEKLGNGIGNADVRTQGAGAAPVQDAGREGDPFGHLADLL